VTGIEINLKTSRQTGSKFIKGAGRKRAWNIPGVIFLTARLVPAAKQPKMTQGLQVKLNEDGRVYNLLRGEASPSID